MFTSLTDRSRAAPKPADQAASTPAAGMSHPRAGAVGNGRHKLPGAAGLRIERLAGPANGRSSGGGEMIRLELPVAVPQRLVTTGRGRVPAPRCQADLGDVKSAISGQQPRPLNGPVAVCTRLAARDGHAGDAGSFGRCMLDTLKAHGLIDGGFRRQKGEWAEGGSGEWAEDGPGCVVLIRQTVAA